MSSIKKIKVYLIATEPSGDVIGSNLIKSLKKVNKHKVQFFGIGGPKMIKSGLVKSLFSINELSIFGIFEILPKIYKVLSLLNKTEKDLLKLEDFSGDVPIHAIRINLNIEDQGFQIIRDFINKIEIIN